MLFNNVHNFFQFLISACPKPLLFERLLFWSKMRIKGFSIRRYSKRVNRLKRSIVIVRIVPCSLFNRPKLPEIIYLLLLFVKNMQKLVPMGTKHEQPHVITCGLRKKLTRPEGAIRILQHPFGCTPTIFPNPTLPRGAIHVQPLRD